MFFPPVRLVVYLHLADKRKVRQFDMDGNSQPLNAICRLYAVSVPPAFLVVLDIVVEHKNIALMQLFKKTKPWKIPRLKYAYLHTLFVFGEAALGVLHVQFVVALLACFLGSLHNLPVIMFPGAVFPVRAVTAQFYFVSLL